LQLVALHNARAVNVALHNALLHCNMLHRTMLHCNNASLVLLRRIIVHCTMPCRIAALLRRTKRRGGVGPAAWGVCVRAVCKQFLFFLFLFQHHFQLLSA
jgi:hypothetical protein